MKRTYEVVIAGAGPVGLWLACELKLASVDVAVIERRTERTAQSRALTIHGRSLEILALRGLAGQLLDAGKQIPTGHYAVLDTRLDFSPFDTRFPFTLFLPQAVTEARLEQRAGELGVALMRGSAVTAIHDHGDGVEVATEAGDLAAGYLVGADGARSIVREGAGIAYEGFDATNTMMLGDVVLSVKPKVPVVSVTNQHGSVMIVPLGDGTHHRIVLIDPLRAHVHRAEPLTLEELANSTARILGEDFQPRAPIWLSRFADETRLAATYRKGRILLAGDAAHIHAPMGGQGMNVGLQDAMNLGWKLAAVIKGKAPEDLLDSYTAERRPVGQILYNNTLAQVALITRLDAAALALRDTLNDLLAMPPVNRRLAGELSGFDVAYGAEASGALAVGRLVEGGRVPDIDLVIGEGITASLYSLLSDGNWLHLSFSPGALAKGPAWLPAEDIRTVLAEPVDRDAFRDIGALLVRPDGYAAAVVR